MAVSTRGARTLQDNVGWLAGPRMQISQVSFKHDPLLLSLVLSAPYTPWVFPSSVPPLIPAVSAWKFITSLPLLIFKYIFTTGTSDQIIWLDKRHYMSAFKKYNNIGISNYISLCLTDVLITFNGQTVGHFCDKLLATVQVAGLFVSGEKNMICSSS